MYRKEKVWVDYHHRRGTRYGVRGHYTTVRKKINLRKAYEVAKDFKDVYDLVSDTSDFINGSKEEKGSIILSTALDVGIPHYTAIRIAYNVLKRKIK